MKALALLLALLAACGSADVGDDFLDAGVASETAPKAQPDKDKMACFCTELVNAVVTGSSGVPHLYRGHTVTYTADSCDYGCKSKGTTPE